MKNRIFTVSPLLLFFLILVFPATATEVPRIINFTKQQYQAHNQNWSLAQGKDARVFSGNSKGLLIFDGAHWTTLPLPNNEIVRAVTVDNTGRVFTGGFNAVGFWETDRWGAWQYTSLANDIESKEEIWHFLPTDDGMLFQSFARMYKFDGEKVEPIPLPGNVMFARQVNNHIIVPVIQHGLVEYLSDGSIEPVPGSEMLRNFRIALILPGPDNTWLVGTQKNGIYLYKDGKFEPWRAEANEPLKNFQLNKGLRLHNGNYAFGTIVNGVLITDSQGNIIYHLNREVGLQNNTVLALMEDEAQHLWVGMDTGIDLIEINEPLHFFNGNRNGIGAVYTATVFEDKLYVGTNQGVFWKPWPSERGQDFQLLGGSQGQVWELKVFDEWLIGAHNNGPFTIRNNELKFLAGNTGSYITIAPPGRKDILLQGTYTGVIVLRKNGQSQWQFSNDLEGFQSPARKLIFRSEQELWVAHPHRSIFKLTLDAAFSKVDTIYTFSKKDGLPDGLRPNLVQWEGSLLTKSADSFLHFDTQTQRFRSIQPTDNLPFPIGNYKIIPDGMGGWFQVFPSSMVWHPIEQPKRQFYISLLPNHEQIVRLSDSTYLFCFDNGYALLSPDKLLAIPPERSATPLIVKTEIGKRNKRKLVEKTPPHLTGKQLRFTFATPYFSEQLPMSYRLLGFNSEWSAYSPQYRKEYTNLPTGKYAFQVKTENFPEVASFEFVILPRWYQTWWAALFLLFLLIGLGRLLIRWHHARLERQERKLRIEKERELQRQRMQANNERLKMEIDNKSRKLADSTMNLVRKNEILTKLKKELLHYKLHEENKNPAFFINKLIKLVDNHLSSEEDWMQFEESFNQLHDNFFKRLKQRYPDLTPGDLKLAAYLKMNLSSKEIAALLNISLRGVENKRYRLRRKMELIQEENLSEVLIHF